jgi:hypothetical protein
MQKALNARLTIRFKMATRHVKNVPGRRSEVQDCQWLWRWWGGTGISERNAGEVEHRAPRGSDANKRDGRADIGETRVDTGL